MKYCVWLRILVQYPNPRLMTTHRFILLSLQADMALTLGFWVRVLIGGGRGCCFISATIPVNVCLACIYKPFHMLSLIKDKVSKMESYLPKSNEILVQLMLSTVELYGKLILFSKTPSKC